MGPCLVNIHRFIILVKHAGVILRLYFATTLRFQCGFRLIASATFAQAFEGLNEN